MTPQDAFRDQKRSAFNRNILWEFTFEEWWAVWEASGKWEQRGRKSGQYCMARYGDIGSYSADNVKIVTVNENTQEKTFVHKEETIRKISLSVSKSLTGKIHSSETKQLLSKRYYGTGGWKNGLVLHRCRDYSFLL